VLPTDSMSNPENQIFHCAYLSQTDQVPDTFAMLGYETDRILTEALSSSPWEAGQLRARLKTINFEGLCGPTSMDITTHTVTSSLYLRQVQVYCKTQFWMNYRRLITSARACLLYIAASKPAGSIFTFAFSFN
jgi:hypothetical protein